MTDDWKAVCYLPHRWLIESGGKTIADDLSKSDAKAIVEDHNHPNMLADTLAAADAAEAVVVALQDRSEDSIGERLAVVALELSDATDDLNAAIRRFEEALVGSPPRSTPMADGFLLEWDGARLMRRGSPLLSCSKETRLLAVDNLDALIRETA